MEACLDRENVYLGMPVGISELVLSGTTLFGDVYFYEDIAARAAREIGVRASLSHGVIELFEGPSRHSIEELTRFNESLREDSLVRGLIGVHSLYSVTIGSIKRASVHSMGRGLRIHMHFAESLDEIRLLRERYGRTPVENADEIGLLRTRPLLARAVYVFDREVEVLARYRPYIFYCPFTIMRWGSGIATMLSYIDKGIPVILGTDSPLTAGWINILFEAKVTYAAQGSKYSKPTQFDPYRMLSDSIKVGGGSSGLGWGWCY
jgi:5-methylthioadenosine/S-adenosylhomocysteine deaminase